MNVVVEESLSILCLLKFYRIVIFSSELVSKASYFLLKMFILQSVAILGFVIVVILHGLSSPLLGLFYYPFFFFF